MAQHTYHDQLIACGAFLVAHMADDQPTKSALLETAGDDIALGLVEIVSVHMKLQGVMQGVPGVVCARMFHQSTIDHAATCENDH